MNYIERLTHYHTLDTEGLLVALATQLDLTADNSQIYKTLGMILLAHAGDERRQHDSCVNHLLRVALLVSESTQGDRAAITLALLHDIVEDYPEYLTGPVEEVWTFVAEEYGSTLADSLRVLTNPPDVATEEDENHEQPVKYHAHIAHILEHELAALVKTIDFCDNLLTTMTSDDEQFVAELQRRYYPVMPQFQAAAKTNQFLDSGALEDYFAHITSLRSETDSVQ